MRTWTVPGYAEVRELDGGGALATHVATGALVEIRYLADASHRDEARRLAELDSPHVVGLYEYVESAAGAATVREHVDGVALPDLMAGRGLRPEAALAVLKGVLLGLTAAQLVGVRHHFAPANVLVDREGNVKISEGLGTVEPTHPAGADPVDAAPAGAAPDDAALAGAALAGAAPADDELAGDGLAGDIRAAYAVYAECLPKPPKPLRRLAAPAATGDGVTLLAELDAAARTYQPDWEARGRRELARCVARRARGQ